MRKRLFQRVAVALACPAGVGGCTPEGRRELDREVTRFVYTEQVGPVHAATVVGAAAGPLGPSGLSAVVADLGLRAAFAQLTGGELPPSPWEVPNPNRPVQIGPSRRVP